MGNHANLECAGTADTCPMPTGSAEHPFWTVCADGLTKPSAKHTANRGTRRPGVSASKHQAMVAKASELAAFEVGVHVHHLWQRSCTTVRTLVDWCKQQGHFVHNSTVTDSWAYSLWAQWLQCVQKSWLQWHLRRSQSLGCSVQCESGKGEVDHSRWTTPTYLRGES